jgi:4-hydroxy-2-oxoheptanedioate aldolase
MPEIPRLNGVIAALDQRKPAFVCFAAAEVGSAQAINASPYDGIVFEMEHRPYDIRALRDCLQYMLDRRQIVQSESLAPAVTPFVRIPPNGGEASQWVAKQVLDQGVYGIVWPHVSTVAFTPRRGPYDSVMSSDLLSCPGIRFYARDMEVRSRGDPAGVERVTA